MTPLEPLLRAQLARFAFDEILHGLPGWAAPRRPGTRLRLPGAPLRLRCLAEKGRAAVYLHTTAFGEPPPPYPVRRAAHLRLRRRGPVLSVFVDALHTVQHWQWTHRERGRPPALRELCHRAGAPADDLARRIGAWLAAPGLPDADDAALPAPGRGIEAAVLPALLRAIARRHPTLGRVGGPADAAEAGGAGGLRRLHDAIEAAPDLALPRACWAVLTEPGFAVLDARCGDGRRLLRVAALLEPLYEALLWRARVAVEESPGRPARPGSLVEAARAPRYRPVVRRLVLQRNLFGLDARPGAIAAADERLRAYLRTGGTADSPALAPCLEVARRAAPAGWLRLRRALEAAGRGRADDAEALAAACRLLRAGAPESSSGPASRGAEAEIGRRRAALLDALAGLRLEDDEHAALAAALAFPDVARRGGFEVRLDRAPLQTSPGAPVAVAVPA